MTNNSRVTHAIHGYSLKFGQVQKRIEESCSFVWVVYGETFRNATLAEATSMREQQVKESEALPFAEIPGIRVTNIPHLLEEKRLAFEATQFCLAHA